MWLPRAPKSLCYLLLPKDLCYLSDSSLDIGAPEPHRTHGLGLYLDSQCSARSEPSFHYLEDEGVEVGNVSQAFPVLTSPRGSGPGMILVKMDLGTNQPIDLSTGQRAWPTGDKWIPPVLKAAGVERKQRL